MYIMFRCPLCSFSINCLDANLVLIQVQEHFKQCHPKPIVN
jgi:hypothetical protein